MDPRFFFFGGGRGGGQTVMHGGKGEGVEGGIFAREAYALL